MQSYGTWQRVSKPMGVSALFLSKNAIKLDACLSVSEVISCHLISYERVDEIIWVKTNQLQRIIRTGRTGHWLNHGKEHCLVCV